MFQTQKMMRKVIYSLIPIFMFSFYLYGFRLIFLSVFVFFFGILTEFIFEKFQGKKVSEAVLVSCTLYVLSLPPTVPWWVASIGIVFGILIGKEVFGGFGRNPFNPAIAGRLFVYIAYSGYLQTGWLDFKNFSFWPDSITSATPIVMLKSGSHVDILSLLTGFHTGSMGEGMIILILAAAIYLLITKTASWEIILSTLTTGAILTVIFYFLNINTAMPPLQGLLSGSFIFVAVFMATDPVSAPKLRLSKFIYGFIIGTAAVVIRTFSTIFPEGTSFAILFGNTFAPMLDDLFTIKEGVK